MRTCDNCGREFPIYRLAGVILDGRIGFLCTRCVHTEHDRIETPYAPRVDQGAIQPSTTREAW
jgi:hypothetical protein